jgi:hypothetical protein
MKVLHLPTTVGGNPQGISRHLNGIGVSSTSWTLQQNYFGYSADKVILAPEDNYLLTELKKLRALHYVFSFDVIFFNAGRTLFRPFAWGRHGRHLVKDVLLRLYVPYGVLMQRIELGLLKLLRKPIFIQYQGSDARQSDYCLEHFTINAVTRGAIYYTSASDALKRRQIALLDRYCHKIYALNPDLLHVLPKRAEFLPYSHVSLEEWKPVYTQLDDRPLRIGHAPSNRSKKGTDLIIAAVENLRRAGYEFEFVLMEGLSNQEAKERYKTIDVLVDQLFYGWYGGLAVECMALGKPVLAYIREDDLDFIPAGMQDDLPVMNVTPDTIEQGLQDILEMPREKLLTLAQRSRNYVEIWHNPITIAQRIKRDMEESIQSPT